MDFEAILNQPFRWSQAGDKLFQVSRTGTATPMSPTTRTAKLGADYVGTDAKAPPIASPRKGPQRGLAERFRCPPRGQFLVLIEARRGRLLPREKDVETLLAEALEAKGKRCALRPTTLEPPLVSVALLTFSATKRCKQDGPEGPSYRSDCPKVNLERAKGFEPSTPTLARLCC